jgi:ABC-type lipoprotein export system ATPase subunit
MIEHFQIRNFKSCKNAPFRFGRITVLIGPNSSGKSSVLQALTLLKQSLNSSALMTTGTLLNLGTFEDVVHARNVRNRIEFGLSGKRLLPEASRPILFGAEFVEYEYSVSCDPSGVFSHAVRLRVADRSVEGAWSRGAPNDHRPNALVLPMGSFSITVTINHTNTIGHVLNFTPTPPVSPQYHESYIEAIQVLTDFFQTTDKAIQSNYFVPAIRGFDQATFPLAAQPLTDFISQNGASQEASTVAANITYNREVEERISSWSKRITGNKMRVRVVPGQRVSVESLLPELTVNIVNEGVGANQLIFPLAQLALAPSHSLIGIEEPEIHLHPKAQAEFSDLLVEVSRTENKQIILTTHSEHILFRLLTNITEKKLSASDLRVYYFKKEGQETLATDVNITEKGQIEGGLPGFFEADLAEFSKYISALEP